MCCCCRRVCKACWLATCLYIEVLSMLCAEGSEVYFRLLQQSLQGFQLLVLWQRLDGLHSFWRQHLGSCRQQF